MEEKYNQLCEKYMETLKFCDKVCDKLKIEQAKTRDLRRRIESMEKEISLKNREIANLSRTTWEDVVTIFLSCCGGGFIIYILANLF